jgi:phage tail sheath gpL-like
MSFELPTKQATALASTDLIVKTNSRGDAPRLVPVSLLQSSINVNTVGAGTPVNAEAADGTVIFSGTPVADESLTINGDVYLFKASRGGAFEITIDANNTTQGDNLVTAITADATAYVGVNAAGTVTITAATKGAAGNDITLATDATGTAVSGTNLTGGVDGTVGSSGALYKDSSYLYVAVADNTVSGTNWRRIDLGTAY